ncbi:glycoside hydrolase [Frankia sp. CcI49]|uniref:glycoside hydrolase family 2 protein n=1 Tax=Frankia sp. CcI49 TaxID=1745382 RepID=UPI000975B53D|nr:glycoside hydrolase family 2 [Frankia sp. CcI49]ONH50302.1 glycoside hydrolase [Frankia sp. CcI49]
MIRKSFNEGWTVAPKKTFYAVMAGGVSSRPVRLPHDGMRDLDRDPASPSGSRSGYFPSAHLAYEKTFDVPAEWRDKTVAVEFEGVYRDAMVYVNGDFTAQRPNGYSPFSLTLDPFLRFGQRNVIRVELRAHDDSRWYTGAGIYRNTWLGVADPVHIPFGGVQVRTSDIERDLAVAAVHVEVANPLRHAVTVRVHSEIRDAAGRSTSRSSIPLTVLPGEPAIARLRHYVTHPQLWDVDEPSLYSVQAVVTDESGAQLDEAAATFGFRTVQVDPVNGLRLNGRTVKLRGGCVHHDHGPLGAAAIDRAEYRRAEILKAAGFNAVRSGHNTISPAFLDACDRVGLLVMDELADVWTESKTSHDAALTFPEWWERDIEAMIRKDFNHPSVIMYSIGNEILEVGRPLGSAWGRRIADKVRSLDASRLVTNAVNGLLAATDVLLGTSPTDEPFDINVILSKDGVSAFGASELVTRRTEETHSQADVCGINYSEARYSLDAQLFPERILVGSETFPGALDVLWELVEKHPQVIGDFAWTAWDHLGEAGVGRPVYADDADQPTGLVSPYPWLLSGAGTIDITGRRRPISYWRETVWGLRTEPYIAVHRPQFHGRQVRLTAWSWDDALESWNWAVAPGSPIIVDVYSDADEVELHLNERLLGKASVGAVKSCIARFETAYEPGTLTAVAYRDGLEVGRASLRSGQGDLRLVASIDRDQIAADGTDLAYVEIAIADESGTVANEVEALVSLRVDGAAELVGFASARPDNTEPFGSDAHTTYEGRVLAILRPTRPGRILLTAEADDLPGTSVSVTAVAEG